MAAKAGKNLEFSVLLDYYGPVLTDKQRNILSEYYNDDLSLAEIAENYGITRQGVRDAIKHGEATLTEMEQKLGSARRMTAMRRDLERLQELVMEVRVCNTGLFTPSPCIQQDTTEMLTILRRMDSQEDTPDGI
ncbi:MAG: YlxM family DNA-binding protein [Gemmiger sp.]|uniref:YlxM family DNA-binding protein n=1 Tax=Gemmiger sp. TaxID=2049027 RepID=UPI002E78FAFB|nr:YlxM family DNA-binding protein [Gemmiger sp.]MEE0800490.1 YlxM family DNA-binding protein [Gemmiger sp.]